MPDACWEPESSSSTCVLVECKEQWEPDKDNLVAEIEDEQQESWQAVTL